MNYYKFNIGDYAAATRHLTMLEHGAYRLLLDLYYTTEQPIPADMKAAARKAGARSKDEAQAVETVLNEFFAMSPDGWVHTRCDAEIALYQQKAETNRAVGRMGGRPKKVTNEVANRNPEITQTVSENNPQETLTTNHKPRTINQEPITSIGKPTFVAEDGRGLNTHNAAVCVDSPQMPTTAGAVCLAMKAEGVTDVNPSHPKLTALLAAGATVDEVVCAARAASKRGKGFAYTLGTLERQRADAANMANSLHKGALPNRADALRAKNHAAMSDWLATQETQNAAS